MHPPLRRRYDLVIFDFDGTLADSFSWFCSVLNGVADRYRFRHVAEEEIKALRGLGAEAIVRQLGIAAWKLPLVSRHLRRLAARDCDTIRLFPGIPAMLAALSAADVVVGIVSSNAEGTIRRILGPGLAQQIGYLSCGASLFGKAPRLVAMMRKAGIEADRVLYLGDEIRDRQAAAAAGCDFGAVSWGYTSLPALMATAPALVIEEPADIPVAILGLSTDTRAS